MKYWTLKYWAVVLAILAGCAANPQERDAGLREQVAKQLQGSTEVNGWNIRVDAINGDITLSGAVTSAEQKKAAERIATSVPGVRIVFNQIVIKE